MDIIGIIKKDINRKSTIILLASILIGVLIEFEKYGIASSIGFIMILEGLHSLLVMIITLIHTINRKNI